MVCELLITFGITLLVVFILKTFSNQIRQHKKSVPCIPGLPIVGNLFQVDAKQLHLELTRLAKQHGDVFSIKILNQVLVVLNSREAISDALLTKGNALAGRPFLFRIHYGFHGKKDIIFGDYSNKWMYMKKVASQALRKHGSGEKRIGDFIKQEMRALIKVLSDQNQQPFDPSIVHLTTVLNAISATLTGKHYSFDDPKMAQYKLTTRLFSETCSLDGMVLDLFPWIRFFPNQTFKKLTHARDMLDELIDHEIEDAKETFDPHDTHCLLHELFKCVESGNEDDPSLSLTLDDVRCIFLDMLVSSTFTTSIALNVAVLMMIKFPQEQINLSKQIEKNISKESLPSAQDRERIPYIEAFVMEILRYISHVPLSLPHYTTCDTQVLNYYIPRNTQVLTNLWALHHNEEIWGDPWEFRPGRFLDDDGELIPPNHILRKSLMPFGAGKRTCLGESLARERLVLFITCLVQNFEFKAPADEPLPSADPRDFELGLILEPKPFRILAIPRNIETEK